MSGPTTLSPHPVGDALASLAAAADGMGEAELWQLSGLELADSLASLETEMRRLEFARLRLLAEFHARDVAGQDAGLSTEGFLRARLRLSPAEARGRVRSARELVGSVSVSGEVVEPSLPVTAAAEGVLSAEHVRVIGLAMQQLPTALDTAHRGAAEEFLANQSRAMDATRIRLLARRLHAVLDPDGSLEDDKPARRELSFRRDVGGMDCLRGRLDAEASATVQAALGALAQPEPAHEGVPDARSAAAGSPTRWSSCAPAHSQTGGSPPPAGRNRR